jgi:hypothetical protein
MNYSYSVFVKSDFYKKLKKTKPNFSVVNFRCNNDKYLLTFDKFYLFRKPTKNKFIIKFLIFWKWYFRIGSLGLSSFSPSLITLLLEGKVIELNLNKLPKKHKKNVVKFISNVDEKEKLDKKKLEQKISQEIDLQEKALQETKKKCLSLLYELDKDGNGLLDLIESDTFSKILKKNEKKICEINEEYIKSFVQVSNFLKIQRDNIQFIFKKLSDYVNEGGMKLNLNNELLNNFPFLKVINSTDELIRLRGSGKTDSRGNPTDRRDIIKWIEKRADISSIKSFKFLDNWLVNKSGNQTIFKEIKLSTVKQYVEKIKEVENFYNSLVLHSIIMIDSLINGEKITFEKIYLKFDEYNMFDSQYQKDTKNLLKDVNQSLIKLIESIDKLSTDITSSLYELQLATEESSYSIQKRLDSVKSSINVSNLISLTQSYQLYKLNKKQ